MNPIKKIIEHWSHSKWIILILNASSRYKRLFLNLKATILFLQVVYDFTKFSLEKQRRSITLDFSSCHDGHTVTQNIGLFHEVSCQQNCSEIQFQSFYFCSEVRSRFRIRGFSIWDYQSQSLFLSFLTLSRFFCPQSN